MVEAIKRGDAVSYWMTDVVGAPPEAVPEMKAAPMWQELEAVAHTLPYDLAVLDDLMSGKPKSLLAVDMTTLGRGGTLAQPVSNVVPWSPSR
jgi:hypothetical protein